jgi:hypothetical protein
MSRTADDAAPFPTVVPVEHDEMDALDRLFSEEAPRADPHEVNPQGQPKAGGSGRQLNQRVWSTLVRYRSHAAFLQRRSVAIAAVVAVVIAQAGLIAYVVARRYTPPVPAPGRLVLETNPTGAAVRINGISRGVTPLTLPLASGEYVAEVSLGASRREFRIPISDGLTVSRHVELTAGLPVVATSGASGALDLRSRPSGAAVLLDGEPRGRTPVVIEGLAPGRHHVVLKLSAAEIQETLTVHAGAPLQFTAAFPETQAPRYGWLSVNSPVELSIVENGAVIGTTRSDRTMLPAGRHSLEFISERLGYRSTRTIEIGEGKVATLAPEFPQVPVNVNALPWAEVWMGERKLGDTPLGSLTLPIGVHELVFRHPSLGERRESVTVTAGKPIRVSIDMRK